MNSCPDLFALSAIACKLSEHLTESELELLAVNLTALGDLLTVAATRKAICENKKD